ncbi:flagellar hook assembly protein FlgD [Varunaivibrio sulfuroxidans]|uniref:Basal-body rod modification protein FlgD n=1 Tax=Varunaivibrio sulfuroxidans TaxID=1773489 RepID=A0A4R3JBW7_9PROT|nr:flagellar hook assembly protein FlgD [Varunaivibrio sulfuroxidans]TCS62140.1 flagellar basal-body rod modification protein FlgD [Varunaivibrio sulfuroxidans]WES30571.1 flagellar hook assembly protein FlgD [Varunaivibrio sulfuroxidans]
MSILSGVGTTGAADTSTQSGQSKNKLNKDLNQFLTLLVTQLKNQDPLQPLKANEFTNQLVQFASVEQQINQNSNLEKLLTLQKSSQVSSMVSYLGRSIEATGQQFQLQKGVGKFSYTLGANVQDTTVTIQNAKGLTVYSGPGETASGKHVFNWDGKNNSAQQMPDGAYTVNISAKDHLGNIQDVAQTIFGTVTGAGVDAGSAMLDMGAVRTKMDNVISVQ